MRAVFFRDEKGTSQNLFPKAFTPLIPGAMKQRQAELCEFEAILAYVVSLGKAGL